MGLGAGHRSFTRVAVEFRVSPTTVRKWARRQNWDQRARDIDRAAASEVEAELGRSLQSRVAETILLADAIRLALMRDLTNGRYKPTARDLIALARLEQELGDIEPLGSSALGTRACTGGPCQ
jgi:hypothetical protein